MRVYPLIDTPNGPLQLRIDWPEQHQSTSVMVYSHGIGAHKDGPVYQVLSEQLNAQGMITVSYDANFAAPAKTDSYRVRVKDTSMTLAIEELQSAVDYAKKLIQPKDIHLCGSSLGAYPALEAAKNNSEDVRSLFLYAPALYTERFTDNRFLMAVWNRTKYLPINLLRGTWTHLNFLKSAQKYSSEACAKDINCPIFLYAGEKDKMNPITYCQQFAAALPYQVTLQTTEDNLHPFSLDGEKNNTLIAKGVKAYEDWLSQRRDATFPVRSRDDISVSPCAHLNKEAFQR